MYCPDIRYHKRQHTQAYYMFKENIRRIIYQRLGNIEYQKEQPLPYKKTFKHQLYC